MKRALLLLVLVGLATAAGAQDATGLGGLPKGKSAVATAPQMKSMSLPATYAFGARSVQAPMMIAPADSTVEAPHHWESEKTGPRGGCEVSGSDLCYDTNEGHVVYRPARAYMPHISGLTPENVSVRRNSIKFRYSFP
jgi:hypothetical protein